MAEIDLAGAVKHCLNLLKAHHVVFEAGLSDSEVAAVELRFGFEFPPDLRFLLETALPVGIDSHWGRTSFPNWRSGADSDLQSRLDWPFDGIAFDIENNHFWHEEWGPRPADISTAIESARRFVDTAPTLIPVCGHRYLPADPHLPGNPVFSVHQTDIIVYGVNLWDYFEHEFDAASHDSRYSGVTDEEFTLLLRPIPFWSRLAG